MRGADPAGATPLPAVDPHTIGVTAAASAALEQLIAEHGPLMFIESHGCCDNNAPMCFPEGEFLVGSSDVKITEVAGCPYYVDARTLGYRNTAVVQLTMHLDIEPGYADGMSLGPPGSHFVVRPAPPTTPPAASDTPPPNQTQPR
jgi:uncharacterized protein (DUF779 family)